MVEDVPSQNILKHGNQAMSAHIFHFCLAIQTLPGEGHADDLLADRT